MSLLDLFRQEYVAGKVMDKYRLSNGNIGIIVDQRGTHKRYHVEFKDDYRSPGLENLFGLLNEPFSGKTEHVDRLINKNDAVELTVSYSKGPFRQGYYLHSTYPTTDYKTPSNLAKLPYNFGKTYRY